MKYNLLAGAVISAGLSLSMLAQTNAVQPAVQTTKAMVLVTDVPATVSDSWDNFQDFAYEKRDAFAASFERRAEKLDAEVRNMNAKLTGLPDVAAKERNRTNKEFAGAQANLKSQLADLRTATADTWDNAKGKVAQSWQDLQTAYEKVRSSPTS